MKRVLAAAAAALFLLAAPAAQETLDDETLSAAEVDASVREQALALYRNSSERIESIRAEVKAKEAELSKIVGGKTFDEAAVEAKLREIADLEVSIRFVRLKTEVELRNLIGKARWAKIRKAMRERAAEKRSP